MDMVPEHKKERFKIFHDAFMEVVQNIKNDFHYTREDIVKSKYWEYLKGYHSAWRVEPLSSRSKRQMLRRFRNGLELFFDIKKHGMRDPLDIIVKNKITTLYRGNRRLVILKALGTGKAKCRYIFVKA